MSDTVRSLNTSGLTPKKQIQCWSDALTNLCGLFDIDPLEASSFEGRINYTTISKLRLCQIEASQHRLAHPASRAQLGAHAFVKILFQTHGISHFEQGGRRIELAPGDCLAYDVSCPHTIVSPTLTRHEVVIVPKELLQERGFRSAKMSACKLSARTGTGRIAYDFVHAAFDEATKLSPNNAIGVADSLIDLLLLPLREPDAMFHQRRARGDVYPGAIFHPRTSTRSGTFNRPDLDGTELHQALSAYVVQRQGHHDQRLYSARKVAELPPRVGDPCRKIHHGRRILVGLFELVALQPRVPEAFRSCSVCNSQSAARKSVPRAYPANRTSASTQAQYSVSILVVTRLPIVGRTPAAARRSIADRAGPIIFDAATYALRRRTC